MKSKTFSGIVWSSLDRFSVQGIQFILSFVIARKLSPSDYGLIAMLSIFMALAQTFIDSGFSNALIQKQNRTLIDFSTVFYFNIIVSVFLYAFLCLLAPAISAFYNQPLLDDIIKWVGLNFVIYAFSTVQRAIMIIELDFKRQAIVSVISVVASGSVAVWLAYTGYGIWTLVVQGLLNNLINVILLWILAHWHPQWAFSIVSFKELFSFGSKLLGGAILHTIYINMYTLIIGKFFTSAELGYYNRSYTVTQYPSSNITNIITKVTYPIECQMQDDDNRLQEKFYLFIRLTAFFVFPLMIGLAALAESLVHLVLTDKWIECVVYIQIMCFAYMWDPIMHMSWDLLNVKHRGDYSLKSEIWKKIVAFSLLFITIPLGIKVMCLGLVCYSLSDIAIVTQYTKRILPQVKFWKVIKSLFPIFTISLLMGAVVYAIQLVFVNVWLQLCIGVVVGVFFYLSCAYLFKFKELIYIFVQLKRN
ncbi:MAG: lipopolysaccharide biosynthesis protein [Bacteroides sp.]|nr:lipopolysaccharide biosynthesis protein [Bacteroides sp.]